MCPACITAAAIAVGGVVSAGGAAALVVKTTRRNDRAGRKRSREKPADPAGDQRKG